LKGFVFGQGVERGATAMPFRFEHDHDFPAREGLDRARAGG
jgi:hypothetical protein